MEAFFQKVETMPEVTALLTSLPGQQRLSLGICLIMEGEKNCRAWYSMSFKNKNKTPTAERLIGQIELECVGVEKGMKGGPGSGQLLRGLGGGGEINTTQSSANSNKQFPPAVTNLSQHCFGTGQFIYLFYKGQI